METLVLWIIGIVLVIVTEKLWSEGYTKSRIIRNIIICICALIVGGIPVGWIVGYITDEWASLFSILVYIVGVCFIVGVNTCLGDELSGSEKALFFAALLVSSFFWFCPYYVNIERVNETIVVDETKQELIYFCDIPVQQISGDISGSSILGFGSIDGNIDTSNEFAYIYENAKGDGIYALSPVTNSKLRFIKDDDTPYVVITTHKEQLRIINHNANDEEQIKVKNEWKEYIFYLPESVKQFGLG